MHPCWHTNYCVVQCAFQRYLPLPTSHQQALQAPQAHLSAEQLDAISDCKLEHLDFLHSWWAEFNPAVRAVAEYDTRALRDQVAEQVAWLLFPQTPAQLALASEAPPPSASQRGAYHQRNLAWTAPHNVPDRYRTRDGGPRTSGRPLRGKRGWVVRGAILVAFGRRRGEAPCVERRHSTSTLRHPRDSSPRPCVARSAAQQPLAPHRVDFSHVGGVSLRGCPLGATPAVARSASVGGLDRREPGAVSAPPEAFLRGAEAARVPIAEAALQSSYVATMRESASWTWRVREA